MPATLSASRSRNRKQTTDPVMQPPAESTLFSETSASATVVNVQKTVDLSPSEKLKNECVGVRLSFNWFSTGKQVDKETKMQMAEAADSDESGFSASKRMMDSKHPTVKKVNELKSRIKGYFDSMTIPLGNFVAGRGGPEPGIRLLPVGKIEELDNRLKAFVPEVSAAQADLNRDLGDIKAMDEKRLKGLYNEEDYPRSISIDLSWGFLNVEVPAALERLSPAVYARECERLKSRMDETYELATATIMEQFLSVVKDWNEILGPVVRIYPQPSNRYTEYHGAEVRRRLQSGSHKLTIARGDDKPQKLTVTVPEGSTSLVIRHYPNGSKKLHEVVIGPLTSSEYADLNPSTVSAEKRTFKATTIEAMNGFLVQFRNIGDTISASDQLRDMVKSVETQLARLGDSDAVAGELRNSVSFRAETHRLMSEIGTRLENEIETFKVGRRRIDSGLLKK